MKTQRLAKWMVLGLLLCVSAVEAATVRWYLRGVTFEDGATASGYFEIDTATGDIGRFAIFTTDGPSIPGHRYHYTSGPAQSYDANFYPPTVLTHSFERFTDTWRIRVTPIIELDALGGTRELDLAYGSGNVECDNCVNYRVIATGYLEGVTDILFADDFEGVVSPARPQTPAP